MDGLDPSTWVISAGRSREPGQPLNVPPILASNFFAPSGRYYSRGDGTETAEALEELVGGVEGGRALSFSSGMAAVAAVLGSLSAGSTLAIPTDPYHGVMGLAQEGEAQGRWTLLRLDLQDTQGWVDAAGQADLIWLESPANPLMTVADLPTILSAPRKGLAAIDATFAPLVQKGLELGADVVMHSATKFFGGHSDLLAGLLVVSDDDLYDQLNYRRKLSGGVIGAMEAFLAVRGMRTLTLRMERAQANAMVLAQRLEAHPEVERVRYPGWRQTRTIRPRHHSCRGSGRCSVSKPSAMASEPPPYAMRSRSSSTPPAWAGSNRRWNGERRSKVKK